MKRRRIVVLDSEALAWAIAVIKDNRFDVEKRGQMTKDWDVKYKQSLAHLDGLHRKARE